MKNITSFTGFGKSVRFTLAFALLFAVGTFGFYACTNKNTVSEDVKPARAIRNDKNTTVFVDFQVPASLLSATMVADRVEERTVSYSDSLRGSVTGISRVTFDAQNKVVKMQLSQSLVDYFDIPVDSFADFIFEPSAGGKPCPCDVRRGYWYNDRMSKGQSEYAGEELRAALIWDGLFAWAVGCYEKNPPGGCN